MILPIWSSYLVRVYSWKLILAKEGILSWLLAKIGLTWLLDGILSLPVIGGPSLSISMIGMFIAFTYIWLPYMILPIQAALERVPRSLLEASADLGARPGETFRTVLLQPDLLSEFNGALAENAACQQLINEGIRPLYYWVSSGIAEIDFLFPFEDAVYPLEVKSGLNLKQKSLTLFSSRYSPQRALRASLANFDQKDRLFNIPLYALGEIGRG